MKSYPKNYTNQWLKKFKWRGVCARFKDNYWAADWAERGSLSSKNRGIKYLLCVIDAFTKYAWVKLLKDRKARAVVHGFVELGNKSNCKPNKL